MQIEPHSPPVPIHFRQGDRPYPATGSVPERRSHILYVALNAAKTLHEMTHILSSDFARTKQEVVAQAKAECGIPDLKDPDDRLEYWTDPITDSDTLNNFIAFGSERVAKVQPEITKIDLIWHYVDKEKDVRIFRPTKLFT